MACQPMHYWTFCGLVGAFLDLIIAYFLLCASTVAYFATKFLGLFRLSLPCPCNGLFGIPNSNYCFQSLLVNCSVDRVSSVQLSVKSRFPFDSVLGRDSSYSIMNLDRDVNSNENGVVEMEGKRSCSSIADVREEKEDVVKRESVTPRNEIGVGSGKERKFDVKGKGIINQRLSSGFRRRRKGGVDSGKLSSGPSQHDPVVAGQQKASQSHREQSRKVDNSSEPVGLSSSNDEMESPSVMKFGEGTLREFGVNQLLIKNETEERTDKQKELVCQDDMINTVKMLEQASEEEHAARAALYLELEKERNAAASAADEAMAMILRLQEEKASIEMEARQYQRIIEEKSAYDAEEMNILKEILLRREREKHFLEKEVEAYRQMLYGNAQLESEDVQEMLDFQRQMLASQFDLTEDPDMMLHQLNESLGKKNMFTEDSDPCNCVTGSYQELKEKEMVSMDGNLFSESMEGKTLDSYLMSYESSSSKEDDFPEKTIPVVGEVQGISGDCVLCQEVETKTVETRTFIGENHRNLEKHVIDASEGINVPCLLTCDKEPDVLDVHVVNDESKLGDEFSGNKSKQLVAHDPSKILRFSDFNHEDLVFHRNDDEQGCPSTSRTDYAEDLSKSSQDMNLEQTMMGPRGRPLVHDLRRNSMSVLDSERSKIDTEVERLRERLRVVQQGREKLKVSMEHRERETLQLQLLEDIACQLREIQQLSEHGKAARQGSLPPPSSKGVSKKRRCRSVSTGLHKCS